MKFQDYKDCTVAVLGLGYVGLPLAIELSKHQKCLLSNIKLERKVIAFDINEKRIKALKKNFDETKEVSFDELNSAKNIIFTSNKLDLINASIFIITVPTPVDDANKPDLNILKKATYTVAEIMKKRYEIKKKNNNNIIDVVIYESTVYPGATEEFCIPIIEEQKDLMLNKTFVCGYSPERINPGDKEHNLINTVKVTSGSCDDASEWISSLYGSFIKGGIYKAKNIKVAEAAKVIENTQRDLNIALINELAMIFNKLEIDTHDVLKTAGSKWNFLNFKPGLVGGHCIGVDPYYLTYKAEQVNYYPEIVLAGRRINNNMSKWICDQIIKKMSLTGNLVKGSRVILLGITFKENCPDVRNTKVIDIINILNEYEIIIDVYDPCADFSKVDNSLNINIIKKLSPPYRYDVALVAVGHNEFKDKNINFWKDLITKEGLIIDLKDIVPREIVSLRL